MSRVRSNAMLGRCLASRASSFDVAVAAGGGGGSVKALGVSAATTICADWTPAKSLLLSAYQQPQHACGIGRVGFLKALPSNRARFSTSSQTVAAGGSTTEMSGAEDRRGGEEPGDTDAFDDPRIAILDAALDHVEEHGFSATALAAGAKDCGFHSVAAGMFPNGEGNLVHHLMAKALQEVKGLSSEYEHHAEGGGGNEAASGSESDWPPSETERLRDGIKTALSCLAPYKAHWPQAISIGLLPQNAGATATAVAVLADELAFLSGDRSTDLAWYGKRGVIGGMYAATELFMLTDESEGLSDTWAFLDRLLADYEVLASSPENAADVATGVSTVASSLSSAAVSLAWPFLKQASKQVPGAETLAQTAPNLASLASQALSFAASQVPHAGQTPFSSASGPSRSAYSTAFSGGAPRADVHVSGGGEGGGAAPPTFPGAPERDPWSGGNAVPGTAGGGTGKFEEELAQEERDLFGEKGGAKK